MCSGLIVVEQRDLTEIIICGSLVGRSVVERTFKDFTGIVILFYFEIVDTVEVSLALGRSGKSGSSAHRSDQEVFEVHCFSVNCYIMFFWFIYFRYMTQKRVYLLRSCRRHIDHARLDYGREHSCELNHFLSLHTCDK